MTKGNGILIGMGFGCRLVLPLGLWLDYLLTKMTMMKVSSLSDD